MIRPPPRPPSGPPPQGRAAVCPGCACFRCVPPRHIAATPGCKSFIHNAIDTHPGRGKCVRPWGGLAHPPLDILRPNFFIYMVLRVKRPAGPDVPAPGTIKPSASFSDPLPVTSGQFRGAGHGLPPPAGRAGSLILTWFSPWRADGPSGIASLGTIRPPCPSRPTACRLRRHRAGIRILAGYSILARPEVKTKINYFVTCRHRLG